MFADESTEAREPGACRRAYNWFCGYNITEKPLTEEEKQEKERKITSIKQSKRARIMLQSLLVVIIAIGVFILAYFTAP